MLENPDIRVIIVHGVGEARYNSVLIFEIIPEVRKNYKCKFLKELDLESVMKNL